MLRSCRWLLAAVAFTAADDTFFLKPTKSGEELALIIIQGASCPPSGYKPVATAIQAASAFSTWIGVPEYIADTPEPAQFGSKLSAVLKSMRQAGMNASRTVLLAHSLGGVMSQIHVAGGGSGIDALILFGATLLRKYRNTSQISLPTLTVDGDLDGLLRVTRQAEAYDHQVSRAASPPKDPVVLLQGLSHWSISSGDPPSNVQKNDLKPEVSEADGHAALAALVAAQLEALFAAPGGPTQRAGAAAVATAVAATGELVAPLLTAMRREGSKHLVTPCDSDYPTNPTCAYPRWPDKSLGPRAGPPSPLPPADCTCGAEWMGTAASMMAALDSAPLAGRRVSLATADTFHDVSAVRPFHLPHIFHPPPGTACDNATGAPPCLINMTTMTMPVYDSRDALDTGLYPTAATELRAKLKSRQAIWQKAGVAAADFDALDRQNTSVCRAINAAAWAWALGAASPLARARLARVGQPLTFHPDEYEGIGLTGPKWIDAALSFAPTPDGKAVAVTAPFFATANKALGDAPYTDTVGYHYCKLLSPARAMEWLYVDGLKAFGGLGAAAHIAAGSAAPVTLVEASADAPSSAPEPLRPPAAASGAPAPCCVTCAAGDEKYRSIPHPDAPGGECGECCLAPGKLWFWRIFEPALQAGSCAAQGFTLYKDTETDGFGPLKVTNDRYVKPNASEPARLERAGGRDGA